MNKKPLNDKDVFPTPEVLQNALGKRYDILKELLDTITGEEYGLTFEWRYYNDGKSWLGKATHGKKTAKMKTIFWLSVLDDCFQIGFHFTEKTRGGVMELNIDETIKTKFIEAKPAGKLVSLSPKIEKKRQLKDVLEIVRYKMTLK